MRHTGTIPVEATIVATTYQQAATYKLVTQTGRWCERVRPLPEGRGVVDQSGVHPDVQLRLRYPLTRPLCPAHHTLRNVVEDKSGHDGDLVLILPVVVLCSGHHLFLTGDGGEDIPVDGPQTLLQLLYVTSWREGGGGERERKGERFVCERKREERWGEKTWNLNVKQCREKLAI